MVKGFFFLIVLFCGIKNVAAVPEKNSILTIPTSGVAAESVGCWQKAVGIYLDLLLQNPERVDLWLRVADIEHRLQNDNLTILAYEHAILVEPNNAVLYKKISELYAGLQNPKQALRYILAAVERQPENLEYIESLAKIANWNKKPQLALTSYQKLLALTQVKGVSTNQVKQVPILLQIANLQQELHADAEALKTFRMIIEYEPHNATALIWIKKYTAMGKTTFFPPLKVLSPFDKYLEIANQEASLHHYSAAIKALKHAIDIKANDAELYHKISEIYAITNHANLALKYINCALKYSPNNLKYLRKKGQLAAWASQYSSALSAYQKILDIKPYDESAMLNFAHMLAILGETDSAIDAYQNLLLHYPNNALGWIYYAESLTWVERYVSAMEALQHYQQLKGSNLAYKKTLARVLALTGYYETSRSINEAVLSWHPNDPYALTTEVLALKKAYQREHSLFFLKKLNQQSQPNEQLRKFNQLITTPLRSNVNVNADYTWATDTTAITDLPLMLQYFITPTTSVLFQGLYERLTANLASGLGTVDGKASIFDESAKIGLITQINGINLAATVGDLKIQQHSNLGIYSATLNTNLNEKLEINVDSLHDLFRPYLVPQTPLLVSLQIMEQRTSAFLQWQPMMQKYLHLLTSYSTLSDNNSYWHVNAWPKGRVFGTQKWLVSLGVDADLWSFARRAHDGYFSPLMFQEYEGTIELYHTISEKIGLSLAGGFGVQKDETLPHFFYAEDLNGRLIYGIYDDYQLQLKGGYTLRANPIKNYQCRNISLILTKRF